MAHFVDSEVWNLVLPTRHYASMGTSYGPLSVSVCHKSVFCQNSWTNGAGFGMWAFSHPSYTVLTGNLDIFKSKSTSFWNSVPNSGL